MIKLYGLLAFALLAGCTSGSGGNVQAPADQGPISEKSLGQFVGADAVDETVFFEMYDASCNRASPTKTPLEATAKEPQLAIFDVSLISKDISLSSARVSMTIDHLSDVKVKRTIQVEGASGALTQYSGKNLIQECSKSKDGLECDNNEFNEIFKPFQDKNENKDCYLSSRNLTIKVEKGNFQLAGSSEIFVAYKYTSSNDGDWYCYGKKSSSGSRKSVIVFTDNIDSTLTLGSSCMTAVFSVTQETTDGHITNASRSELIEVK